MTENTVETTPVKIVEWKTIGTQELFTVLGLGEDNQVYFWKDQKWNTL